MAVTQQHGDVQRRGPFSAAAPRRDAPDQKGRQHQQGPVAQSAHTHFTYGPCQGGEKSQRHGVREGSRGGGSPTQPALGSQMETTQGELLESLTRSPSPGHPRPRPICNSAHNSNLRLILRNCPQTHLRIQPPLSSTQPTSPPLPKWHHLATAPDVGARNDALHPTPLPPPRVQVTDPAPCEPGANYGPAPVCRRPSDGARLVDWPRPLRTHGDSSLAPLSTHAGARTSRAGTAPSA